MNETASNAKPTGKNDLYGVAGVAAATLLILALGYWPYSYYQFLRIATCVFSLAVVYRPDQIDRGGWFYFAVVGTILFNPLFPIRMHRDGWTIPDLIFGIGYGAYGLQSMSKRFAKFTSNIIWVALGATMILTFYVNHYLPHGPSLPTGDYACQHGDRGGCGEIYKEDMSMLDIPDWARSIREGFVIISIILCISGIYAKSCSEDDDLL